MNKNKKIVPNSGPESVSSPPVLRRQPAKIPVILQFQKEKLLFLPILEAIQVIHELHLRSIGSHLKIDKEFIRNMSIAQAKNAYRMAISCFVANFCIVPPKSQKIYLKNLVEYCSRSESFGGFESAFLTMIGTISTEKQSNIFANALSVWKKIGPPQYIGGGFKFGFFVNTSTNIISYFDRSFLQTLVPGASNWGLFANSSNMSGAMQSAVNEPGMNKRGLAEDGGNNRGLVTATCGVLGLAAKWIVGGTVTVATDNPAAGKIAGDAAAAAATIVCVATVNSVNSNQQQQKSTCPNQQQQSTCPNQQQQSTCPNQQQQSTCPNPPVCHCPTPACEPSCGCCSELGAVVAGIGCKPACKVREPGGNCCSCGVSFGQGAMCPQLANKGHGGDPGPCCSTTEGAVSPGTIASNKPKPIPGCCAAHLSNAFVAGLTSMGAISMTSPTVPTIGAANSLSIKVSSASYMLLGVPLRSTATSTYSKLGILSAVSGGGTKTSANTSRKKKGAKRR